MTPALYPVPKAALAFITGGGPGSGGPLTEAFRDHLPATSFGSYHFAARAVLPPAIAAGVLFLASDARRAITGQALVIEGGMVGAG